MIPLGPIFQAVGAVVDLIIEAVENFSVCWPISLTMTKHKNTDSSRAGIF